MKSVWQYSPESYTKISYVEGRGCCKAHCWEVWVLEKEEESLEAPGRRLRPIVKKFVNSHQEGFWLSIREIIQVLQKKPALGAHKNSHNLPLGLRIGMSQEENQGRKVRVLADFLSSLISKGFSQSNTIGRGLVTSTVNNSHIIGKIRDF